MALKITYNTWDDLVSRPCWMFQTEHTAGTGLLLLQVKGSKSLINIRRSNGLKNEPWGTPFVTFFPSRRNTIICINVNREYFLVSSPEVGLYQS